MYAPIPSVISSVGEEGDFIAQSANKDYKGLPARSHRKIQTHCHLHGNFPSLGEERATKKGTEPLADAIARLLGMRGPAPRPHGSSGTLSSQAFFWRLLHRRPCGGSSLRTAPSAPSPRGQPRRLGGRCKEQPPNLALTPWSGASIPLQARGHRRSRTPRAQCSSADPTEAEGWCARPLRSSPNARKHSSSTKCLKKPGHPIWGPVPRRQGKHYKI
jgi:hypothetical protein